MLPFFLRNQVSSAVFLLGIGNISLDAAYFHGGRGPVKNGLIAEDGALLCVTFGRLLDLKRRVTGLRRRIGIEPKKDQKSNVKTQNGGIACGDAFLLLIFEI